MKHHSCSHPSHQKTPQLHLWFFSRFVSPDLEECQTAISNMSTFKYFSCPSCMAYRDLCTLNKAPEGIRSTLGLGLKFCVQSNHPRDFFGKLFWRFRDDICKKFFFIDSEPMKITSYYIYVKLDWVPPVARPNIENRIKNFCYAIYFEHKFLFRWIYPYPSIIDFVYIYLCFAHFIPSKIYSSK